jgi:hypothetical protein
MRLVHPIDLLLRVLQLTRLQLRVMHGTPRAEHQERCDQTAPQAEQHTDLGLFLCC